MMYNRLLSRIAVFLILGTLFLPITALAKTEKGDIYFFGAAVAYYKDKSIGSLPGFTNDMEAFVGFLKGKDGGKVPDKRLEVLYDDKATRSAIYKGIKNLSKAKKEDTVIIYLSMHGSSPGGLYSKVGKKYFVPYDAFGGDIEGSCIPMDLFAEKIYKHVKAKNIVIFLETCFSGAAIKPFKDHKKDYRRVGIIASSFENKVSWGIKYVGGIYGWLMVTALSKGYADSNEDDKVTLGELDAYLKVYVTTATIFFQKPKSYIDSRIDNLVLSRTKSKSILPKKETIDNWKSFLDGLKKIWKIE